MNRTLIGCLEAFYVIYMFNWFKTTVNFAPAISYFADPLFNHPIDTLEAPRNLVCKFGKNISWLLGAYLIGHGAIMDFYPDLYPNLIRNFHIGVLCFSALLSLMNLNTTVYLLPFLLLETWFLYTPTLE